LGVVRVDKSVNAVDHGDGSGEVGVRDMVVGVVVVGLIVGVILGRNTERARRSFKDWETAKTALKKGRSIALVEFRRAAVTILIIAAVLIGLFRLAVEGGGG
jgi:hypothetical protein